MLEEFTRQILSGEQDRLKQKMYCFCWMQILRCCAGRRTGSESIFAKTMEISARSSMEKRKVQRGLQVLCTVIPSPDPCGRLCVSSGRRDLKDCRMQERKGIHRYSVVTAGKSLEGEDFSRALKAYRVMSEQ